MIAGLLVTSAFFGVAHSGMYLTERTSGFVPVLFGLEVIAIQLFNEHATPVVRDGRLQGYSESYTRTSAYMEWIESGHDTDRAVYYTEYVRGIDEHRMSTELVAEITARESNSVILYRSYYAGFGDVKPPPMTGNIYDSGDAKILQ
jgi:hypothetical protein